MFNRICITTKKNVYDQSEYRRIPEVTKFVGGYEYEAFRLKFLLSRDHPLWLQASDDGQQPLDQKLSESWPPIRFLTLIMFMVILNWWVFDQKAFGKKKIFEYEYLSDTTSPLPPNAGVILVIQFVP